MNTAAIVVAVVVALCIVLGGALAFWLWRKHEVRQRQELNRKSLVICLVVII